MNMLDVQDKLKNLSEEQLVREMQMPSGSAPQFLVLSEITRRKRMRDSLNSQKANGPTVAEEVVASAGVPQGGLASMAQALAPQSSIAQNTGFIPGQEVPQEMPVQGMYGGGPVKKMQEGRLVVRDGRQYMELPNGQLVDIASGRVVDRPAPQAAPLLNRWEFGGQGPTSAAESLFGGQLRAGGGGAALDGMLSGMGSPGQVYQDYLRAGAMERENAEPVDLDLTSANPSYTEDRPDRFVEYEVPPVVDSPRESLIPPPPRSVTDLTMGLPLPAQMGMIDRMRNSELPQPMRWFQGNEDTPPSPALPAYDTTGPDFELVGREFGAPSPSDVASAAAIRNAMPLEIAGGRSGFSTVPPEEFVRTAPRAIGGATTDYVPENVGGGTPDWLDDLFGGLGGRTVEEQRRIDEARAGAGASAKDVAESPLGFGLPSATVDGVGDLTLGKRPVGPTDLFDPNNVGAGPSMGVTVGGDSVPVVGGGTGGGSGGGGGGGGGGFAGVAPMSSYEQELINAIQRSEKRAEQDKWLALAQVGLQLMSSTQPTIGGALGEAATQGLGAYREARNAAEDERLGLSKALYDLQSQQAAALAAQRSAGAKAAGKPLTPLQQIKMLEDYRDSLYVTSTNEFGEEISVPLDESAILQINDDIRRIASGAIAPAM